MSISTFRFNVLFLLLIVFVFPVSNSFAQSDTKKMMADTMEETQEEELATRAPRETDGQLAWKFTEGLSIKIDMDQTTTIGMMIGEQPVNTTTKAVNELSLNITSVDGEGVASAVNTIDRMVVSTKTPALTFEFDSNNEDDGEGPAAQMAQMIRPMVGQPMTQKMRANGEVFDVTVPAEALKGMNANPQTAGMFSEKKFQEMATKGSLVFPEPNLEVGRSWTVSQAMDMGVMKVNTSTEYTYRGVADVDGKPMHVVVGDLTMEFPGNGGPDIEITEQDAAITFYFDGVAGRMAKSELDQDMKMVVRAGGQEITQRIKQSLIMTMTVVE